jgi:DNA-binding XRE family transcriptional regulator
MPKLPRLREHRLRRLLTQEDLARIAHLSPTTIVHLERGQDAKILTVRKLSRALRVQPAELMREEL